MIDVAISKGLEPYVSAGRRLNEQWIEIGRIVSKRKNADKYCWKKPIKNIKNVFKQLLFYENIYKICFIYRRRALEIILNVHEITLNIFNRNNNAKLLGFCWKAKGINPSSLLFFQKDGIRFFFLYSKATVVAPGRLEVNKGHAFMREPNTLFAVDSPLLTIIEQLIRVYIYIMYHVYVKCVWRTRLRLTVLNNY